MGKTRIPHLSDSSLKELEQSYRQGQSHAIRQRSHIVLLKSQGHSSKYISELQGYPKSQDTINNWVTRYEELGRKRPKD